ncbi:MAG: hypothetical protein K2H78_02235, partial [Clostridia bacterium]|nr:hypothetical protein [Clostridia bacterium]
KAYSESLGSAISALYDGGLEEDKFYSAISDFKKSVDKVYNRFLLGGTTAYSLNEGKENSLKLAYDSELKNSVIDAALLQSYNCIMDVYVREKLAAIFGVSLKEVGGLYDDLIPAGSSGEGNGEGGGEGSQGGYGDGSENYGSKDFIYDTDSGEQVEYGKVYNDYYSKVDDRIKSGDLPQDLVDFIEVYFKILLNGINKENSEAN